MWHRVEVGGLVVVCVGGLKDGRWGAVHASIDSTALLCPTTGQTQQPALPQGAEEKGVDCPLGSRAEAASDYGH
jgi:hypothetical protein